jgi:ABC-type multidrug transport system ATPase subunit
MFLDEPTAGIDPVARRELWNLLFDLSARGVTFFVTTHYMDEAERCSHLGYIYFAKLMVSGSPQELKALDEVTPEGCQRLEVRTQKVAAAMRHLNAQPYVRDATIFSDALHVVSETGQQDRLVQDLVDHGFPQAAAREIPPTLEDVFVTLTKHRAEARNV